MRISAGSGIAIFIIAAHVIPILTALLFANAYLAEVFLSFFVTVH